MAVKLPWFRPTALAQDTQVAAPETLLQAEIRLMHESERITTAIVASILLDRRQGLDVLLKQHQTVEENLRRIRLEMRKGHDSLQ